MKRLLPAVAFVLSLLGGHALAETLTFTTYYYNDHLGNPVAATDERGDLLWRAHFTPYGERHENPADNAFGTVGYTGHAHDKTSGLVYMGARYYDPVIGRFMAVDPVGFQDQNPQSFGRYLYANNNPHKYMDPDGQSPLLLFWAGAAAFGGAMAHSDYANAPAPGEEPATMSTFDHLGALPSLQGAKGAKFLGMKDEAKLAKGGGFAGEITSITQKQLDKKFKHASDFGVVTTKKNPETLAQFESAIKTHMSSTSTVQQGTYGFVKDSKVFFNSTTNNAVVVDGAGNFVTGFKLAPGTQQFENFIKNGVLR